MAIRSGRFKVTNPSDVQIISGRSGTYFRFFNSGADTFTIKVEGSGSASDKQTNLRPTFSVDMVIAGDVRISGSGLVEGMYDFLENLDEVRSGRFNIKVANNPDQRHPIILVAGTPKQAYYRIFNSGDHPIVLERRLPNNSFQVIETIQSDQSFDFEVGGTGASQRRFITVKSTQSAKPIEGIYDFLGT